MRTKFAAVEISLQTGSGKFGFPNDNFLNGKRIVGLSVSDNSAGDGYSQTGRPLVTNAAIAAAHLTVRTGSDAQVLEVPLKFFQESTGDRQTRKLDILKYNPGTTFITFQSPGGTAPYTTAQSVEVTLEYVDND